VSAGCYAAVHAGAVVPEIGQKELSFADDLPGPFPHPGALFGSGHQLEVERTADGHVVEDEAQQGALLHYEVDEFIRQDLFDVVVRGRQRDAEGHPVPVEPVHRRDDPVEYPGPPAGVGALFEPFERQAQQRVAGLGEPLADLVVDEGGVRVDHEEGVLVLLKQLYDALAF